MTRKPLYWTLLLGVLLGLSGCVTFRELTLYENSNAPLPGINGFTATEIFHDNLSNEVWGVETAGCKSISLSKEVVYKGNAALKLNWDRTQAGCKWIGMGIGWNSWVGKDLTPVMENSAIEFYMRTEKGDANYVPIIFCLEDYSGVQSFAVFNPIGVEGGKVTEEWTRVLVPLSTFSFVKTGGDPSNIKQLQLELQGTGNVYIDEIRIVPYESPYKRTAANLTVQHQEFPVALFNDEFANAWGLGPKYCENFVLDKNTFKNGYQSVRVEVAPEKHGCGWDAFGFSWNKWLYTDLSTLPGPAALSFFVKTENEGEMPTLKVVFQDYEGHEAWVEVMPQFIEGGQVGSDWTQVKIPMKQFHFAKNEMKPEKIKQIRFHVTGQAPFYLDEISLIEFRGNPNKPW